MGFRLKRIGIWLFRAALAGVLGVVLLLTLLWRERNQPVELPIPTGTFAVGRAIYDWIDHTTVDTLAQFQEPNASSLSGSGIHRIPANRERRTITCRRRCGGNRPAQGLMSYVTRDVSKVQAHSLRNPDLPAQPEIVVQW